MEEMLLFLLVTFWLKPLQCTVETTGESDFNEATNYLRKYGYLKHQRYQQTEQILNGKLYSETLKTFQRFSSLEETGVAVKATINMMRKPRCGQYDLVLQKNGRNFVVFISDFLAKTTPVHRGNN